VNKAEMAVEMASTRVGRALGWAAGITLAVVVGARARVRPLKADGRSR